MGLLGISNAKTIKGEYLGYMTGVMYFLPHDQSVEHGGKNVCPFASPGCASACLVNSGRGRFDNVKIGRLKKTLRFFEDRPKFLDDLRKDIKALIRKAERAEMTPCVRLNGTSDLPWHKYGIIDEFPELQFYDYTKSPFVAMDFAMGKLPPNYHITFSRSETNHDDCLKVLEAGGNVSVVFDLKKKEDLPKKWRNFRVVDADKHDLRFLDGKGVIAGLRIKGDKAMQADARESGFSLKPRVETVTPLKEGRMVA